MKLKNIFKSLLSLSLVTVLIFSVIGCDREGSLPKYERGEVETSAHSKTDIADAVLGAWVGSAIGLGSGFEYCTTSNNPNWQELNATVVDGTIALVAMGDEYWEPDGQICAGSIGINDLLGPINDPRVEKNKVISDDDMHVDILNQFIFRDYGPDIGAEDIAAAWDYYGVSDVGGGETVTSSIRNNGYVPPFTGQSAFGNVGYWVTESWIENEMIGLVFPYMYQTCSAYADLFCSTQGDALCLYLGRLCALMQTLAYEYDDATVVMEKAFETMDHYNEIYEIYQFVKGCYEGGLDWRTTCVEVVKRAVNCKLISLSDTAGFSINANAGMIFIGLFYGTKDGKTDFEESVKITSLCGLDGDCTASTVGGIVGAMYGYDALPEKYTEYIGKDSIYYNYNNANTEEVGVSWGAFAYCAENFPNKLTFQQIADLTVSNIEAQIENLGGSVDGNTYNIPVQELKSIDQVSVTNASFENGTTSGWSMKDDNDNVSFDAVTSNAHLGKVGAMIDVYGESNAKIYQDVKLVKGHTYRAEIWVNGLNDREFRFYADGKNTVYRSIVNPLTTSGRHMKAELVFTADSENYELGVWLPQVGEDEFITVFIDDLAIEDITTMIDASRTQTYEAENCYMSSDSTVVKDRSASGKKAVNLISGGGIRTDFTGLNGFQIFRIYYANKDEIMENARLSISLDGEKVAYIPLVANGSTSVFNNGNFVEVRLAAGTGTHTLKLELASYYDVQIDKIEILAGNITF